MQTRLPNRNVPETNRLTIANIESCEELQPFVANKFMPAYTVGKPGEPWQYATDERPQLELRIDSELVVRVTWLDTGPLVTLEVGICGVALPNLNTLIDLVVLVSDLDKARIVPDAIAIEENDE